MFAKVFQKTNVEYSVIFPYNVQICGLSVVCYGGGTPGWGRPGPPEYVKHTQHSETKTDANYSKSVIFTYLHMFGMESQIS